MFLAEVMLQSTDWFRDGSLRLRLKNQLNDMQIADFSLVRLFTPQWDPGRCLTSPGYQGYCQHGIQ